jgi:hypothetical protein
LPHFIRRDIPSTGCTKFVKILKITACAFTPSFVGAVLR